MSELKIVHQWQHSNRGILPHGWWQDCTEEDFKARDNKPQFNVRIVFETTAVIESLRRDNAAQAKRIAELEEDLQFVERWANHHGTKPNITAQEALSCIQHYPSIAAITKGYKDGVIPNTRNPYAEIEAQAKRIEELEAATEHLGLTPQQAKDGLARHTAMREVMEVQRLAIKTQQEEIEVLRKQVEILKQTSPTSNGFCGRSGGCVCGGDLPRVRESCSNWVKSTQKGTEHGAS